MYLIMVVLLMAALPILSIIVELITHAGADIVIAAGRWFLFWGCGARLGIAGVRQILQPDFTAKTIFETQDPGAAKVVQELGFANVAMGVAALIVVFNSAWIVPGAVAGTIFYGLAGLKHVQNTGKNRLETIATVSDLWMAAVLAVVLVAMVVRH